VIDIVDLIQVSINALEDQDHKRVLVSDSFDPVLDEMEAAGSVFYCARAADESGMREVYFVREPQSGFKI
jgi:hypothetical protein